MECRRGWAFFFAVALLLAHMGEARAYSKDGHELITRQALKLIGACKSVQLPESLRHAKGLVRFNRRQDRLLRKARLWHFPFSAPSASEPCSDASYSNYSPVIGARWGVLASIDPWLRYLIAHAEQCNAAKDIVRATGALLHYLQDLAVPAHAVPIFHPFPRVWSGDGIDGFPFEASYESVLAQEGRDICQEIATPPEPTSLLHDMRLNTLDSLKQTIEAKAAGQRVRVPWSTFWRDDLRNRQAPEFGSYGCGTEFGRREVTCVDNVVYAIERATYLQFASARAGEAILASAKMIVSMGRYLASSASGASCSYRDWFPSSRKLKRIKETPAYCRPLWPNSPLP